MIKCMREQCVPGSSFPLPQEPGYEAKKGGRYHGVNNESFFGAIACRKRGACTSPLSLPKSAPGCIEAVCIPQSPLWEVPLYEWKETNNA